MAAESSLDVQSEMISEVGVGISVSYILVYAKENTNSPLHIIIIISIILNNDCFLINSIIGISKD